jgi:hypothetical protein
MLAGDEEKALRNLRRANHLAPSAQAASIIGGMEAAAAAILGDTAIGADTAVARDTTGNQ